MGATSIGGDPAPNAAPPDTPPPFLVTTTAPPDHNDDLTVSTPGPTLRERVRGFNGTIIWLQFNQLYRWDNRSRTPQPIELSPEARDIEVSADASRYSYIVTAGRPVLVVAGMDGPGVTPPIVIDIGAEDASWHDVEPARLAWIRRDAVDGRIVLRSADVTPTLGGVREYDLPEAEVVELAGWGDWGFALVMGDDGTATGAATVVFDSGGSLVARHEGLVVQPETVSGGAGQAFDVAAGQIVTIDLVTGERYGSVAGSGLVVGSAAGETGAATALTVDGNDITVARPDHTRVYPDAGRPVVWDGAGRWLLVERESVLTMIDTEFQARFELLGDIVGLNRAWIVS